MKPRVLIAAALLIAVAWVAVRSQLWTVARPGDVPRPLALVADHPRAAVALDATLPAAPVGSEHLVAGRGVLLIHYWAPWEHAAREQVTQLDSLRQLPEVEGARMVVVCFDPFPSVARFVARQRLRLSVVIDRRGVMREVLPCPSVPYTYVLDAAGRIAVSQAGEVDWLARGTREALRSVLAEPAARPGAPVPAL